MAGPLQLQHKKSHPWTGANLRKSPRTKLIYTKKWLTNYKCKFNKTFLLFKKKPRLFISWKKNLRMNCKWWSNYRRRMKGWKWMSILIKNFPHLENLPELQIIKGEPFVEKGRQNCKNSKLNAESTWYFKTK